MSMRGWWATGCGCGRTSPRKSNDVDLGDVDFVGELVHLGPDRLNGRRRIVRDGGVAPGEDLDKEGLAADLLAAEREVSGVGREFQITDGVPMAGGGGGPPRPGTRCGGAGGDSR